MDKPLPEPPAWDAADYAKNSQGQYGWAIKPMRLANVTALEGWLRTTWMTYWQRVPVEDRADFLKEFTERVRARCDTAGNGELLMSMVNLEIEAHKDRR